MIATDMTSSGSTEEKLRWAFKMYDEDGSGDTLLKIYTSIQSKTYYDMTELRNIDDHLTQIGQSY